MVTLMVSQCSLYLLRLELRRERSADEAISRISPLADRKYGGSRNCPHDPRRSWRSLIISRLVHWNDGQRASTCRCELSNTCIVLLKASFSIISAELSHACLEALGMDKHVVLVRAKRQSIPYVRCRPSRMSSTWVHCQYATYSLHRGAIAPKESMQMYNSTVAAT